MGQAVQFFGVKAVLDAYENMGYPAWSILQAKQFQFKYEGEDQAEGYQLLEKLLNSLMATRGSTAIYTLRVYADDTLSRPTKGPNRGKVKIYESTPYDGSFNFRLYEEQELDLQQARGTNSMFNLQKRMETMEELLKQMVEQQNEPEQDQEPEQLDGIAGVLKQMMDMPQVKEAIAGKVVQMVTTGLDKIGGLFNQPAAPARIAGPTDAPASKMIDVQKLNQALVDLASVDPELTENLVKLARIAKRDPDQYRSLVGMLKNLE